jgi:hypothetical protein
MAQPIDSTNNLESFVLTKEQKKEVVKGIDALNHFIKIITDVNSTRSDIKFAVDCVNKLDDSICEDLNEMMNEEPTHAAGVERITAYVNGLISEFSKHL